MAKSKKLVRLVHNPNAGAGKEHFKDDLVELLEKEGYSCDAVTTKNTLRKLKPHTALIAVAGGDGTVRETILRLLDKKLKHKKPIALFPLGTANNIATAFGIDSDIKKNIVSWSNHNHQKLDVGRAVGFGKPRFFIESFGFGLFPELMDKLDKREIEADRPEDEFKIALQELLNLADKLEGTLVQIDVNDESIEMECILVEVMNIASLGPKLNLCKEAQPGDGFFNVVLVGVEQREILKDHIRQLLEGKEVDFPIDAIQTNKLSIRYNGTLLHADDQLLQGYNGEILNLSLLSGLIEIIK